MGDFDVYWDAFGEFPLNSGIGSHCRNLISSLQGFGLYPTFMVKELSRHEEFGDCLSVSKAGSSSLSKVKLIWPHLSFKEMAKKRGAIDHSTRRVIFHGLSNINLPFLFEKPAHFRFVLTVHDLIPLLCRTKVSWTYKLQFQYMLPRAVQYADTIICVSPWTKQVLCQMLPDSERKIVVIENGVDHLGKNLRNQEGARRKGKGLNLLYVARWEDYKGFDLLLGLCNKLPENTVIRVVTDTRGIRNLSKLGSRALKKGTLRLFTGLSQEEMLKQYQFADLYLHFSEYEGFGLPVWEALSCQTPVIFRMGSALDFFLQSEVSWGLPKNAIAEDWLELLHAKKDCKYTESFQSDLLSLFSGAPTWAEAALKVKEVYNLLR